jgi:alcohol dehydrogenase
MRMRAAVLREVGKPLVLEDVELDGPHAGEVLVKIRTTGVCHSDIHYWQGHITRELPMVLGHEAAGEVVETGPGVTSFAPGDRVTVCFLPACGRCAECVNGRPMFCEVSTRLRDGTMPDGSRRLRDATGRDINTLLYVSSFAEYSVVPEASLVTMPDGIGWRQGALFGCGFTTGFAAATRTADLSAGDTVVVVGCGAVGLATIMGAAFRGASRIFAVDTAPASLAAARDVGATDQVESDDPEEIAATVLDATAGLGADCAFECVGGGAIGATVVSAYHSVRRGGTVYLLGLGSDTTTSIPVSPLSLVTSGRTVKGVLFGGSYLRADLPRYAKLLNSGRLDLDPLIGRTLPFSEINSALSDLHGGTVVGRTVLELSE